MPGEVNGKELSATTHTPTDLGRCAIAVTSGLVNQETLSVEAAQLAAAQRMLIAQEPLNDSGYAYVFLCERIGCEVMCGLHKNSTHFLHAFTPPDSQCRLQNEQRSKRAKPVTYDSE